MKIKTPSGLRSNKVIRQLTITFILGICIVWIVNTVCMAMYTRQRAIDDMVTYEDEVMNRLNDNINNMNDSAMTILQLLDSDKYIREITTYDNLSDVEILTRLSQIPNYNLVSRYVNNYYLINRQLERVCSRRFMSTFDNFNDKEILELIEEPAHLPRFKPIPRQNVPSFDGTSIHNYFTYLQFDPTANMPSEAFLVLNISENWIQDTIDELCDTDEQVLILDADGKTVLTSKNGFDFEEDFMHLVIDKINGGVGQEFVSVRLNGRSYIALSAAIDDNKDDSKLWTIIRLIPASRIYSQANTVLLICCIIGLLVLMSGLFVFSLLSKRIYQPVGTLIERVYTLERQKDKAYPYLKEIISNLIHNSNHDTDPTVIREMFAQYGIRINLGGDIQLVACRVDNYAEFCDRYDARTRATYKYAITNVAQDLFKDIKSENEHPSGLCMVEGVDVAPDTILLILNGFTRDVGDSFEDIRAVLDKLQKFILQELDFSFSCAISDAGMFGDIKNQYNQAQDILDHRFTLGRGVVLSPDDVSHQQPSGYKPLHLVTQKLSDRMLLMDYEQAKVLVLSTLKDTETYSYSTCIQVLSRISNTITDCLYTLRDDRQLNTKPIIDTWKFSFDRAETMQDIREAVNLLFEQLTSMDDARDDDGSYIKLVEQIRQYIEENYSDSNLSLNMLADHFKFSPAYLGRIFKRITNNSVLNYITDVRLSRTADMLVQTDMNIKGIAAACGIDNPTYLYTLFKKKYKQTPGEYKQLHSRPE